MRLAEAALFTMAGLTPGSASKPLQAVPTAMYGPIKTKGARRERGAGSQRSGPAPARLLPPGHRRAAARLRGILLGIGRPGSSSFHASVDTNPWTTRPPRSCPAASRSCRTRWPSCRPLAHATCRRLRRRKRSRRGSGAASSQRARQLQTRQQARQRQRLRRLGRQRRSPSEEQAALLAEAQAARLLHKSLCLLMPVAAELGRDCVVLPQLRRLEPAHLEHRRGAVQSGIQAASPATRIPLRTAP